MAHLPPLVFEPLPFERPWGGHRLQELYQKPGVHGKPVGETWEVADRAGAESVVAEGEFKGASLRWFMEHRREDLLGLLLPHFDASAGLERFPWLIKCLDCAQTLSLQVHPSPEKARRFGGEPKTELWYVTRAAADACLWAGLERHVEVEELARDAGKPGFARHLHQIAVRAGDALFLPSGRLHAPGAGVLIFEVQENSDTTYRLYDWDRVGVDGRPRALHLNEGLASIDVHDLRPRLVAEDWSDPGAGGLRRRTLAECEMFRVNESRCGASVEIPWAPSGSARAVGVVEGWLRVSADGFDGRMGAGRWVLIPASAGGVRLEAEGEACWLEVGPGHQRC